MTDGNLSTTTADDGIRLAYTMQGRGNPVVIAPAMSWIGADIAALAEHCTLVCYDIRSQGRSDRARDDQIGFERDVADLAHRAAQALPRRAVGVRRRDEAECEECAHFCARVC